MRMTKMSKVSLISKVPSRIYNFRYEKKKKYRLNENCLASEIYNTHILKPSIKLITPKRIYNI